MKANTVTSFSSAAEFYDAFYQEKPYGEEARYVLGLIDEHRAPPIKMFSMVEFGCGSLGHAAQMRGRLSDYLGLDASAELVAIAEEKIAHANLSDFIARRLDISEDQNINRKFDVGISLFHVVNYMSTRTKLKFFFSNMKSSLADGGIFVLDFWNYANFIRFPPKIARRVVSTDSHEITRVTVPAELNVERQTLELLHEYFATTHGSETYERRYERSVLKLWTVEQLVDASASEGFQLMFLGEWGSSGALSLNSSYGVAVLRKAA